MVVQGKHIIGLSIISLLVVGVLYFVFQKPDENAEQIYQELISIIKYSDDIQNKSMDEILAQEIDDNALFEIYIRICEKCEYGMELNNCNDVEKTVYLLYDFNAEVGNGGIEQFICNAFENRNITLERLHNPELENSYQYLSKALDIYSDTRKELYEDQSLSDKLSELDDQYYDLHDEEYNRYIYDYVNNHKSSFRD